MITDLSLPEALTVLMCAHDAQVRLLSLNHETIAAATLMELELRGRIRGSRVESWTQLLGNTHFCALELLDTSSTRNKASAPARCRCGS
jgi:hypothetical protein